MNTIAFDVESVPQQAPLTDIQQEELGKQLEKTYIKNPDWDEIEKEKYRRLIMGKMSIHHMNLLSIHLDV